MRAAVVIAVAPFLLGCKKQDKPPEPYTGPLTAERILSVDNLVKPFDKWERAFARLQGKLGKPTRVKDQRYGWAVVEGDSCTYFEVEQDEGQMVGTVQSPMKVAKDGPIMNLSDCKKVAGIEVGPPEDPGAPGPPEAGQATTLDVLRDAGIKARSRWKGKRVLVDAQHLNSTTATSGSQTSVSISLVSKQGDEHAVGCTLAAGEKLPDGLMQYTDVRVEGTVNVNEWMSMGGGEPRLEVDLSDCKLVPRP